MNRHHDLRRPVLTVATALVTIFVATSCGPCEQSTQDKKEAAVTTVGDFLTAVQSGNYEEACSLLGLGDVNGDSTPRQAPGWPTACRERYLPENAALLRNAEVGKAVDVEDDAGAESFPKLPFLGIGIYDDKAWDVDTAAVTFGGASELEKKLRPGAFHDLPIFGLSNYEGVAGGCDREWCIIQTPLGPVGKP